MLILVPFWISILVRLFALTMILGRHGIVNTAAEMLHLGGPYPLLFNTTATVIGMVAYLLPYMILILYAGMVGIDTSLITAAKTLGASGPQAFRRVYFPLVRPSLVGGILLIFVLSLGFFLTPSILGGAQNTTIPIFIAEQVSVFQWGTASATGILLLAISVLGYAIALRVGVRTMLPGGDRSVGRGSVEREALQLSLSSIFLWVITVSVLVGLLLPLVVVIPSSFGTSTFLNFPPQGFTTHWYTDVLNDPTWTSAITKSLWVGLGTAVISTSIGLILARLLSHIRNRNARSVLQASMYAPVVVPVILLAVGIYDVEIRLNLIGTSLGLALAHTVIAFPLAFAILSNALANLDPELEAAAWTLGASRFQTFWRIVIPNIVPSVIGALLISFVTSWDEVVIALFQTEFEKTLPVTIYSLLKSGVTPAVAAVATMLIGVVLAVVVIGSAASARVASRRARFIVLDTPTVPLR
jgi:putative spermidine/putrescine transport system permease protein